MMWNDRLIVCDCLGLTSRCVLFYVIFSISNATFWRRPRRLYSQAGPGFYPTEPSFHVLSLPPRPEKVSFDENMPGHLAILGRVEVSYELAWLTASEGSVLRQNNDYWFFLHSSFAISILKLSGPGALLFLNLLPC